MSKFLIVGLGNIGNEYANTRHNIGFDVLNAFVAKHNASFSVDRLAYKAEVKWKGKQFICICPTTYMNLSGRAFRYWIDKEKIALENTLTVVDDLALPIETLRLRASGSSAGHNGLKDIENIMGTNAYPKLMQADFVLSKWKADEIETVKLKINACVDIIEQFATIGLDRTMSEVNNKKF